MFENKLYCNIHSEQSWLFFLKHLYNWKKAANIQNASGRIPGSRNVPLLTEKCSWGLSTPREQVLELPVVHKHFYRARLLILTIRLEVAEFYSQAEWLVPLVSLWLRDPGLIYGGELLSSPPRYSLQECPNEVLDSVLSLRLCKNVALFILLFVIILHRNTILSQHLLSRLLSRT